MVFPKQQIRLSQAEFRWVKRRVLCPASGTHAGIVSFSLLTVCKRLTGVVKKQIFQIYSSAFLKSKEMWSFIMLWIAFVPRSTCGKHVMESDLGTFFLVVNLTLHDDGSRHFSFVYHYSSQEIWRQNEPDGRASRRGHVHNKWTTTRNIIDREAFADEDQKSALAVAAFPRPISKRWGGCSCSH